MALLFPPPALSPKPPFPSTLRSTRPRRATCISSVSSPRPPASAPSPSTSSPYEAPALDGGTEIRKNKKRRNLKPSFEEQALRRWSARAPSLRASFPWQRQQSQLAHREDERAEDHEPSSATLRSIVEYFDYDSSEDGGGGVGEGKDKGNDGVAHGEAAQDRDEESRPQPNYLLGTRPFSAPWMHGQEGPTVVDRPLSGPVGGDEEEAVRSGVFDDELDSEDEDEEWVDNSEVLEEEPMAVNLEEELYEDEDPAAPTASSSFPLDSILEDQSSTGSGFDRSIRRSSVSSIVNTLRNSMEESATIGSSEGEDFVQKLGSVLLPWEREEGNAFDGDKRGRHSNTKLAERTIPEPELRRLRDAALRMKERMRVGPGGVTHAIVENIHSKWKVDEVVKMRFEGPPSLNMKRTHEILEDRTGGTVIWRSGRSIVLYRGMNYNLRCVQSYAKIAEVDSSENAGDAIGVVPSSEEHDLQKPTVEHDLQKPVVERNSQKSSAEDVKRSTSVMNFSQEATETFDIDSFLDQLGPRYKDWSGRSPVPVDADLLPGLVPGYKPPFRQLPYRTKISLKDKEMTALRRLARQTAPHFALGRNREHQGLAAAIVKVWEKSSIVKIAIKRGVPNTCNDRMAEEIKKLTGGVLVSRNKEYINFYRGNDFVTPKAKTKVAKAEMALAKVQEYLSPAELPMDLETITDEERFLFRRIGLKMKAFLMLGRREVFDGTVQNMHFHWKHRELVKIVVKGKTFEQVKHIAISLEAESGGVLIALDKTTKGYSIIFYRGKNYKRPQVLKPRNLLTRRRAMARSIELQRREALNHHISVLRHKIWKLKSQLVRQFISDFIESNFSMLTLLDDALHLCYHHQVQMRAAGRKQDAELLQTVEDDLSSDDDNIQDEGDEAYLQTYGSDDEDDADDDSNEYL
ncbi:Chloroplastic group IIA intron splicing facilitator CRS1, chloroplastic [Triticum urartu]|uniref:CRM-domain containing factor CFM3, chloroplastic/mitochondrial n=1 Tax=Triticum urartu TaxID=4572 RepID=M7YYA8_TRIUA|nr:Chloroplastic group IIA intron splicing facilitator CRS1, chloroplastic [Triticum urartu]